MKMKKIYDIAPDMYYKNVHLMKDCCLIPYTFNKIFGYTPVIVTAENGDYTYLNDMPEYIMDFQPSFDSLDDWGKHCTQYVKDHYKDMDILFCFGPYPTYSELLPVYKKLRPDGKVILKLDANLEWMDRIPYKHPMYEAIFSNCDLITCECALVKKYISAKWPYKVDYVPNGFLDVFPFPKTEYSLKENTILTVAEIGRNEKNHPLLLEAFAKCADMIPDWKLKLVGSIRDDFRTYIDNYYNIYPELRNRVIFTGPITDKNELYNEYAKAKVFALTSDFEGMPNVFAEAARAGCYTVCSEIEAADEFIGFGKNGKKFPIGDTNRLSEIFIEICNESFESVFSENFSAIKDYANRYFRYETMVRKLHYMIFNE